MKRDQFLLTSSIVQFALFLPLAWWASKHRVPPSDVAITHLLQQKQSSCSRVGVKVLNTLTGSAVLMNVLVVPVAALLWRMHLRVEAIMMIVTCWMGGLVRSAIKQVVNRPRPNPLLVHVGTQTKGKSFPSGHVAGYSRSDSSRRRRHKWEEMCSWGVRCCLSHSLVPLVCTWETIGLPIFWVATFLVVVGSVSRCTSISDGEARAVSPRMEHACTRAPW